MISGMEAIDQLIRIKDQLENKLRSTQAELSAINKAIELVRREHLSLPESTATPSPVLMSKRSNDISRMGLSDAIRAVIRFELVTPSQVRDSLLMGGFPVPKKGKGRLLNYVFVTMKRFAQGPEFERGEINGKFAVRRRKDLAAKDDSLQTELPVH